MIQNIYWRPMITLIIILILPYIFLLNTIGQMTEGRGGGAAFEAGILTFYITTFLCVLVPIITTIVVPHRKILHAFLNLLLLFCVLALLAIFKLIPSPLWFFELLYGFGANVLNHFIFQPLGISTTY